MTSRGALSRDTTVKWSASPGAARYRIHWRRTDQQDWPAVHDATGTETILKQVPIDDSYIGVSAVTADGAESLVTLAGRGR